MRHTLPGLHVTEVMIYDSSLVIVCRFHILLDILVRLKSMLVTNHLS